MNKRIVPALLTLITISAITRAEVFLPGMQPKEAGIEFAKVSQCKMCHGGTKNGEADPYFSWQSGMMANAAKDPLYRAAVTISNQDVPGSGEFCIRCHAPRGWLEGRSTSADSSLLNREDLFGVSCDVCHKMMDPLSAEAASLIEHIPPGRGNAMMVADPKNMVRGPYGDGKGAMPHSTMKSDFHASSELCATCHDISNPIYADDINSQQPHTYSHLERTYSEWLLSDYAKEGQKQTCQSCHYKTIEGGGQASRFGSLHRDHFVQHGPIGGSTWIQDVIWDLWDGQDLNREALDLGKKRALELLKTSAKLELNGTTLKITNLTGHKLPTGYSEARRMWINIKYLGSKGETIKEVGTYGQKKDTIFGKEVEVPDLLDPEETVVYEIKPGFSEAAAKKYAKEPGPSFHFVLNDIICKDNRIPPKGFNNAAFAKHLSQPIGAEYADGQYWDDVELDPPPGCKKVSATLMFQSTTWDYIKFLAEENETDDWGTRLYASWQKTGQCPPVAIAEIEKDIDK